MHLDIQDIKKINVQAGDIIVVQIDVHQFSLLNQKQRLTETAKAFASAMPTGVKVIVVPEGYSFTIISGPLPTDASTQPTADPLDNYDRAMKGF